MSAQTQSQQAATPQLTGQVAIVTGASKGIGAQIAKDLAAAGAAIVVNYASSKSGADRVVAEITKAGGKAVAVQADVSKPADIDRLFAETIKTYDKINILVNNAGIYEFGPLEEVTPEHFHKQFDLNVFGLLWASKLAAKHFGSAGGSIINISSVVSTSTVPNAAVYSATKAAVDSITRSLAQELGPRNIRVNSINPGMTETEGVLSANIPESEFGQVVKSQTPLGRLGRPDDMGPVAVFLASPASKWITGQSILVSGGQR